MPTVVDSTGLVSRRQVVKDTSYVDIVHSLQDSLEFTREVAGNLRAGFYPDLVVRYTPKKIPVKKETNYGRKEQDREFRPRYSTVQGSSECGVRKTNPKLHGKALRDVKGTQGHVVCHITSGHPPTSCTVFTK